MLVAAATQLLAGRVISTPKRACKSGPAPTPASATVDFIKDGLISGFRELLNDQDLDQAFGDFIVPTASFALQATASTRHETGPAEQEDPSMGLGLGCLRTRGEGGVA
jgi:hypothetical protein